MSSKASSTIGFERRFNHALTITTSRTSSPRRRRRLAAAPAEHGADRRAEPRPVRRRRPQPLERWTIAGDATIARRPRARTSSRADTLTARSTSRSTASFSTKAAFLLGRRRARRPPRRDRGRGGPRRAGAACRRRSSTSPATSLDPPSDERLDADRRSTRSSGCSQHGEIEVLDVREKDERDGGYIPESPPHPVPPACGVRGRAAREQPGRDDLRERRAGEHRGEHPGRGGIDARPVLHGGVADVAAARRTCRRVQALRLVAQHRLALVQVTGRADRAVELQRPAHIRLVARPQARVGLVRLASDPGEDVGRTRRSPRKRSARAASAHCERALIRPSPSSSSAPRPSGTSA